MDMPSVSIRAGDSKTEVARKSNDIRGKGFDFPRDLSAYTYEESPDAKCLLVLFQ